MLLHFWLLGNFVLHLLFVWTYTHTHTHNHIHVGVGGEFRFLLVVLPIHSLSMTSVFKCQVDKLLGSILHSIFSFTVFMELIWNVIGSFAFVALGFSGFSFPLCVIVDFLLKILICWTLKCFVKTSLPCTWGMCDYLCIPPTLSLISYFVSSLIHCLLVDLSCSSHCKC